MKDSGFFDAARRAKDSVAAKTGEFAAAASKTGDAMKDIAAGAKGQLADAATDLKQLSQAKLEEALADFNAALPLLREAGYVLDGVKVKLGLTPQVVADFAGAASISDEQLDELLAAHANHKLTTLMLKSLRQATRLQSKLTFKGMRPAGLSVDVGLIPLITVKFARHDS